MKYSSRSSGFTLIELLVVIAIIGILAAVTLASLSDSREAAKMSRTLAQMKQAHTAMEMLYNDTGLYPHGETTYCPPTSGNGNEISLGLDSSGLVGTDGSFPGWDGPYIRDVTDPWGNPYYFDEDYYCTAGAYGCDGHNSVSWDRSVIVSCGPDGMTGDDTSNSAPSNGSACAYNDDNVVYVLCKL